MREGVPKRKARQRLPTSVRTGPAGSSAGQRLTSDDGGMDLSQPPRYDLGFPCRNPACREPRHPYPACPHELLHQVLDPPLPPGVPPLSSLRARQHISKLEEEGRLEPVRPPDMRWLWLVPPILVIFFLLMLF